MFFETRILFYIANRSVVPTELPSIEEKNWTPVALVVATSQFELYLNGKLVHRNESVVNIWPTKNTIEVGDTLALSGGNFKTPHIILICPYSTTPNDSVFGKID